MKKIIRTSLSALRILALVISALGLVGCALAQTEGSFWDLNYELALNISGFGAVAVFAACFAELLFRIQHVNRDTPLYTTKLTVGLALIFVPFIWAFIAADIRAIHAATFIASCGACVTIGFVPKKDEKLIEIATTIHNGEGE